MRAQKSPSGKRYYRCVNYALGQSCEHRMIPADMAESKVIETILGMAHSSNIGVESTNVQARTRDIEQEITELKEALTRIDLEWEEGFILKDAYLEKRQRLQTELSRLQPFDDTEITETRWFIQKLAANW